MNNLTIEKYVRRRIPRVEKNISKLEHYSSETHAFHGGWSQGYQAGQLSVLEDILDMIDEFHEEEAVAAKFRSELIEKMKEKE